MVILKWQKKFGVSLKTNERHQGDKPQLMPTIVPMKSPSTTLKVQVKDYLNPAKVHQKVSLSGKSND